MVQDRFFVVGGWGTADNSVSNSAWHQASPAKSQPAQPILFYMVLLNRIEKGLDHSNLQLTTENLSNTRLARKFDDLKLRTQTGRCRKRAFCFASTENWCLTGQVEGGQGADVQHTQTRIVFTLELHIAFSSSNLRSGILIASSAYVFARLDPYVLF